MKMNKCDICGKRVKRCLVVQDANTDKIRFYCSRCGDKADIISPEESMKKNIKSAFRDMIDTYSVDLTKKGCIEQFCRIAFDILDKEGDEILSKYRFVSIDDLEKSRGC